MRAPTFPLHLIDEHHPGASADWPDGVSRRAFLHLLGAGALAAAQAACAQPTGDIVPYEDLPREQVPGVPLHFATAMTRDGHAVGLILESREGRPVKVEGNPQHPASLGAAGVFEQASLLELYNPDRPGYVTEAGEARSWIECATAFSPEALQAAAGNAGAGLHVLLEPTASPLLIALIGRVRERFPAASFHTYGPLAAGHAVEGARLAFGRPLQPVLDLEGADVILAADADLVARGPFHLRYARQFADRRRVRAPSGEMSRLYVLEGAFTPTGVSADHRLAVRPGDVAGLLLALLQQVEGGAPQRPAGANADWLRAAAADLAAHRGRAVVAVGDEQPPIAHAIGALLNEAVGATGRTVTYVDPVTADAQVPGMHRGLRALADAIRARQVGALVVLGGNPSYDAPADLEFARLAAGVPLSLYCGMYRTATAHDTRWFVPAAHYLESWGDARALDGTASIVQPLIAPLHGGRTAAEVLGFLAGDRRAAYDVVRDFWRAPDRIGPEPEAWTAALRSGVAGDFRQAPPAVAARRDAVLDASRNAAPPPAGLQIVFTADPSVHDGSYANNPWLQELPDPITKVSWDNAAFVSEATAARIGARPSELIDLELNGRRLRAPLFVAPGVADDVVRLPFGYGIDDGRSVARGVGVNAYRLWTTRGYVDGPVSAAPAERLGSRLRHTFAVTQFHWSMEGRPVALHSTLERFRREPDFTHEQRGALPALYTPRYDSPRQWGMAVDLNVCTGCNACVVACQAENNIPVVGKAGVVERREMYWLRVDRYLDTSGPEPRITMQPMLCQHCEDAPCEYVCPVNATVHSPDGLNEMIYNRCVGTRFCSNNCPYKVRRFNWFNYNTEKPDTERLAMNPDVTVRARGVMEKCTFCVQRIRRADIDAAIAGSDAPYRALQTACQQACPTRAIVFGSLADREAEVARVASAPQSYQVLHELGTRPRVHYLARLRNTHPSIDGGRA